MQYAYKILHFFFIFFIKGEDVNFSRPDITLATTIWQFIDFPTDCQTIMPKQATFMRIVGFPGVVGAIDGTHVHIVAYRTYQRHTNRKQSISNNLWKFCTMHCI